MRGQKDVYTQDVLTNVNSLQTLVPMATSSMDIQNIIVVANKTHFQWPLRNYLKWLT